MRNVTTLLLTLLLAPGIEAVGAQEVLPTLPEGSRVWVTITPELGGRTMEGAVAFSSRDTLKILEKKSEAGFAFGVPDVLEIEVDDLVGAVDLAVLEVAPHRIKDHEAFAEFAPGVAAPFPGFAVPLVHYRSAKIDLLHAHLPV